jgi:hypothetical protein
VIPFLDVLVTRKEMTLAFHPVNYENRQCDSLSGCSGHEERYDNGHQSLQETCSHQLISQLQFQPSTTCETRLIQGLHNRASTICQERDLLNEISRLRCDLQLNGHPQGFTDPVINSKGNSHPNKEEKPLGSVYIPYVKGVLENYKHIGNQYNIRTIFKTKHTL